MWYKGVGLLEEHRMQENTCALPEEERVARELQNRGFQEIVGIIYLDPPIPPPFFKVCYFERDAPRSIFTTLAYDAFGRHWAASGDVDLPPEFREIE